MQVCAAYSHQLLRQSKPSSPFILFIIFYVSSQTTVDAPSLNPFLTHLLLKPARYYSTAPPPKQFILGGHTPYDTPFVSRPKDFKHLTLLSSNIYCYLRFVLIVCSSSVSLLDTRWMLNCGAHPPNVYFSRHAAFISCPHFLVGWKVYLLSVIHAPAGAFKISSRKWHMTTSFSSRVVCSIDVHVPATYPEHPKLPNWYRHYILRHCTES